MPKYNCYVKMEVLCWIPNIEAKDKKEAEKFAESGTENWLETIQWERCENDDVIIESYEQVGDTEVYESEEEEE